jgi:two-component system, NarL family, response regulator DegU
MQNPTGFKWVNEKMDTEIRIVIVDDHPMFRQSLRQIIDSQTSMRTVAEAENGLEAVKQVQQHNPDIVIMDIRMPVLDGIDAARQIKSQFPEVKIIALSSHSDQVYIDRMLQAGACAYLNKICSRKDLIERITSVFQE